MLKNTNINYFKNIIKNMNIYLLVITILLIIILTVIIVFYLNEKIQLFKNIWEKFKKI